MRVSYFPEVTENPDAALSIKYEAEQAELFKAKVNTNNNYASGKSYVGEIDYADSYVKFGDIQVAAAGTYNVDVWFANGSDFTAATGKILVNGKEQSLKLQGTQNWGRFMAIPVEVELNEGSNVITFMKGTGFYELDYIVVRPLQAAVTEPTTPASATLTGPAQVQATESFDVELGFTSVTDRVYAEDLNLTYDPNLVEYVGVDELKEGFKVVDQLQTPGHIRIIMVNLGAGNINDHLLKLKWKAQSIAQPSRTNITLTKAVLANASGVETQLESVAHSLQIATVVDKAALNNLIAQAQDKHQTATEGTSPGQYPASSKADLWSAISQAKAVADHASSTQGEVEQAILALREALNKFLEAVISASPGDTNGDGKYSIADLGILAAAYGMSSEDADWEKYKQLDLYIDNKIDINDLAIMAQKILQ